VSLAADVLSRLDRLERSVVAMRAELADLKAGLAEADATMADVGAPGNGSSSRPYRPPSETSGAGMRSWRR
jgi:hypothetical protein